jgi:hypothetical protein
MSVRQIQVANDSVQDRLILRIGTSTNEEIRVFFTRRFLRDLWPHLAAMLTGHLAATNLDTGEPNSASGNESSSTADGEDSEQSSTQSTRFDQAFQNDNPTYPLGAKPLLATEAILEANGEGSATLTLREGRERSFKLSLNVELLQALCAMLRAANEHAGWDLSLDHTPPVSIARPPVNSLLH